MFLASRRLGDFRVQLLFQTRTSVLYGDLDEVFRPCDLRTRLEPAHGRRWLGRLDPRVCDALVRCILTPTRGSPRGAARSRRLPQRCERMQ